MLPVLVKLLKRLFSSVLGVMGAIATVIWIVLTVFGINLPVPKELLIAVAIATIVIELIRINLHYEQSSVPQVDFAMHINSTNLTNLQLFNGHRHLDTAGTGELRIDFSIQNKRALGTVVNLEIKAIETNFPAMLDITKIEFRRAKVGQAQIPVTLKPSEWTPDAQLNIQVRFQLEPHKETLPKILKTTYFRLVLCATQSDNHHEPIEYLIEIPDFADRFEYSLVEQIKNHLQHPTDRYPQLAGADEQIKYLRLLWRGE